MIEKKLNPLISIIVPIYNVGRFLKRCLNSILSQDYKNIEVLLIDDGSSDDSSSICDNYCLADKRFKVIHQKNGGLSCARNKGLDLSNGDFVTFIDGDDYVASSFISTLFNLIINNNADFSAISSVCINENGNLIGTHILLRNKTIYKSKSIDTSLFELCVWNKMFKRKLIGKTRFIIGSEPCEDALFIYDIVKKTTLIRTSEKQLYFYNQRESSILHSGNTIENTCKFVDTRYEYLVYVLKLTKSHSVIRHVFYPYLLHLNYLFTRDGVISISKKKKYFNNFKVLLPLLFKYFSYKNIKLAIKIIYHYLKVKRLWKTH